jgi:hypothetical protein
MGIELALTGLLPDMANTDPDFLRDVEMSISNEPRRAGLRDDERDPDQPPEAPGSAGGGKNMAGLPDGGLAGGGLSGMNKGDGSVNANELEDGYGAGIYDHGGDHDEGGPPYAGPSGGAVGGSPAEKRASGGQHKAK